MEDLLKGAGAAASALVALFALVHAWRGMAARRTALLQDIELLKAVKSEGLDDAKTKMENTIRRHIRKEMHALYSDVAWYAPRGWEKLSGAAKVWRVLFLVVVLTFAVLGVYSIWKLGTSVYFYNVPDKTLPVEGYIMWFFWLALSIFNVRNYWSFWKDD